MAIRSHPLTYEDLQRLRETSNERLELIGGEIVVTPSPSPTHQRVLRRLSCLIERFFIDHSEGEHFFAPLDVRLADGSIVQPDIVAVLANKLPIHTSPIDVSPDVVVEVVSPSARTYDFESKRALYAQHGVPEYWLVDPDAETITICSDPAEGRYQDELVATNVATSKTIPGLPVDLTMIFAPAPGR